MFRHYGDGATDLRKAWSRRTEATRQLTEALERAEGLARAALM